MSNTVEQIVTALETGIVAKLGSTWSRLDHVHDLSKNSLRSSNNRFGVRPLSYTSQVESTILRYLSVDHDFEVILTRNYINRGGDSNLQTQINQLFDDTEDLAVKFFVDKLFLPSIVISVSAVNTEEPEILEEDDTVAIRCVFTVKYRKPVDTL